jgi:hypothetical protein
MYAHDYDTLRGVFCKPHVIGVDAHRVHRTSSSASVAKAPAHVADEVFLILLFILLLLFKDFPVL